MHDKEIIQEYLSRNEDAISNTEKKYGAYCYTVSFSILHNPLDVQECLNDTWLKAWNSIPPMIPENLRLFLAKIIRNISFDRYRHYTAERRNKHMEIILEELDSCIPSHASVEQEVNVILLGEEINLFLSKQSRKDQDLFVQRYFYTQKHN